MSLTTKLTVLILTLSNCVAVVAQHYNDIETAVADFESRPHNSQEYFFTSLPSEIPQGNLDQIWWGPQSANQMNPGSNAMNVSLESLLISALQNSKQIKVFSDLPLIRQTAIVEADAAFDWTRYLDTAWNDLNEPVGSTLTTGGPPRLESQDWNGRAGLRRQNIIGGQFDVSQEIGNERSNSVFFIPNDQGSARLALSYTQPLRRGSGEFYNRSLVVLAQIDASIAHDEYLRQLQSHLLEVTRAYWSLYMERISLLQLQRLYQRSQATLDEVVGRAQVDGTTSQVSRVRAAVSDRRAQLIRAQNAVLNAQDRILALVNDPELAHIDALELIPSDLPICFHLPCDMQSTVCTALRARPEVAQALKQIRAACRRMGMAQNEMLPQLDLVLRSYLAGLSGDDDIGQAWIDQFTEGQPSYSVGLNYEIPIYNRAARARLKRRQLEVRQLKNQFDTTVETLLLEVKTSVREVDTSYREMIAKHEAMVAAETQLSFIQERWKALPGQERSISLFLEDLLDSQQKLTEAEFEYLSSVTTYNLSVMNLKRAQGTLLQDENIAVHCHDDGCLPTLEASKFPEYGAGESDVIEVQNQEIQVTEALSDRKHAVQNTVNDGQQRSLNYYKR